MAGPEDGETIPCGQPVKAAVNDRDSLRRVGGIIPGWRLIESDSASNEIRERAIGNGAVAGRGPNPHAVMKCKSVYDPPAIFQVGGNAAAHAGVCSTNHYRGVASATVLSPHSVVGIIVIPRRNQHGIARQGIREPHADGCPRTP